MFLVEWYCLLIVMMLLVGWLPRVAWHGMDCCRFGLMVCRLVKGMIVVAAYIWCHGCVGFASLDCLVWCNWIGAWNDVDDTLLQVWITSYVMVVLQLDLDANDWMFSCDGAWNCKLFVFGLIWFFLWFWHVAGVPWCPLCYGWCNGKLFLIG